MFAKKVGKEHHHEKYGEAPDDPGLPWTIRGFIQGKDDPRCKDDLCNDPEGEVLSGYEGKEERVRNNERDEWYGKDTKEHDSFSNVFHDAKNYTTAHRMPTKHAVVH
jgi:hypothetical protein